MTSKISALATVQTEQRWTPAVVKAFVKDEGEHCPYCGSPEVHDAMESDASGRGWGILWACNSCHEQWWNEYDLQGYEFKHPFKLKIKVGKRAYRKEPACPHCGADSSSFNYDSLIVSSRSVDQFVRCEACLTVWAEVSKLRSVTQREEL